jgi:hypothetical protein
LRAGHGRDRGQAGGRSIHAGAWVKIKNRAYSQAVGRSDFFDRRRSR